MSCCNIKKDNVAKTEAKKKFVSTFFNGRNFPVFLVFLVNLIVPMSKFVLTIKPRNLATYFLIKSVGTDKEIVIILHNSLNQFYFISVINLSFIVR